MSINKKGFTLFEVITVMIVIAIVVGVSLRLIKAKLSNILSYNYYSAYHTLFVATREMLSNFSTNSPIYIYAPGAPVVDTCSDGQQVRVIDGVSTCVTTPVTIPRYGQNFCELLASYANTRTDSFNDGQECRGDAFAGNINNEENFADLRPDIVLRNGMRIYNLSVDPYVELAPLQGNSNDRVYYTDDDVVMDIDTTGYIAFIDVDGSSGSSILWQDVFPFFITMSGKVIPAYNNNIGGSNKEHLSVSAYNEIDNAGGRRLNWLVKSVSFKEAACTAGFIKAATPYCSTAPAVGISEICNEPDSDCRTRAIFPIKWFN